MNEIGFSDRIFGLAEKAIGHIPGGLGHANVLASMIFAGMSGSAMADAGGLGAIEIKAMNEAGYDKGIFGSHHCGLIWDRSDHSSKHQPCDLGLSCKYGYRRTVYGRCSSGYFDGPLLDGLYLYRRHEVPCKAPITPKAPFKDFLHALWRGLPALGAPAILLGGISTGVFTSTETGAVACAYIILLGFCYRRLNFAKIMKILKETMSTTALTMWLCATGSVFNWMIINSGITKTLSDLLLSLNNEIIVLLLLNLLLFCSLAALWVRCRFLS